MQKAPNRTRILRLRVTDAEKALIEERARTAGLKPSEYIRREAGIGHFGTTHLRRAVKDSERIAATPLRRQTSIGREEAREKARAALAA